MHCWTSSAAVSLLSIYHFHCVRKDLSPFSGSVRGPGSCIQLGRNEMQTQIMIWDMNPACKNSRK